MLALVYWCIFAVFPPGIDIKGDIRAGFGVETFFSSHTYIITRRRNPFLPEVWSPLQATVHLYGIFCLPWHGHSGTRDHDF
jgi:hypothetical protein